MWFPAKLAAFALVVLAFTGGAPGDAAAQSRPELAANVLVPQGRSFRIRPDAALVEIAAVDAVISVVDQVATTTIELDLRNPGARPAEAEVMMPVPDGAAIRGFALVGSSAEPTAKLLPKAEARKIYDEIVARAKDPGLLEFAGNALVRSSVFPVPAHGTQKVRLVYETLLERDGKRVDYVLPRSEALDYRVPWTIRATVRSSAPIATIYSPSHAIQKSGSGGAHSVALAKEAALVPGPFRLSWLTGGEGVTASVLAYPTGDGGGYFLLLAGAPERAKGEKGEKPIPREVSFVIDRSGSMRDGKLDQVKEAALQVLAGLGEGEAFNLLTYNDVVDAFRPEPVLKTPETVAAAKAYLAALTAQGGTTLHDALLESMRPAPRKGFLPIVLFLTDGLPTVGERSEVAIRDLAAKSNPHRRRVFTFGVGVDVNTALLDKVARTTRAKSTLVLPGEDVEVKVGQVFRRLAGPVLAEPELRVEWATVDGHGPHPRPSFDVVPARLDDLFDGDQIVVLGRYRAGGTIVFALTGQVGDETKSRTFMFDPSKATTKNAFIPRLWAGRRIATLTDAIRDSGAAAGGNPRRADGGELPAELQELVDEIVRLSLEFGILTEYTAFLALDGTELNDLEGLGGGAGANFERRARQDRSGWGSVNQDLNNDGLRQQAHVNPRNGFLNDRMEEVEIRTVQQVNDLTFFRRGATHWVDARLLGREALPEPTRTVVFGSDAYRELVTRLAAENRAGAVAFAGSILLRVGDEIVLVKAPVVSEK